MNNLKKIMITTAVLCGVSSVNSFAQTTQADQSAQTVPIFDYNPSWYIAPTVSVLYPDQGFGINDHGIGGGLRIGTPLSEDWDIQLGTNYARVSDNGQTYQQNLLGADALYMFSRGTFRPFLFFGVGAQEDRLSSSAGSASGYAPYVNAGLGFQAVIDDQWSVQADFRRVHGFLRDNAFAISRDNNNYLMVSINYAFDKSPTRPVVVPAPQPAPVPVAAPAPVLSAPPPAPRIEKITLSSTELFAFDKAELTLPQPKLDEIAQALNQNQQINQVVISGFTDRLGSDKYNVKLSDRRANAVRNYLIGKGVDASRLTAKGMGKADPVAECAKTKRSELIKCLEPNRRVEVEQFTIERRLN